jgi:hypothetical protein
MIRGMIYLIIIIILAGFIGIFLFDRNIPINDEVKESLSIEKEINGGALDKTNASLEKEDTNSPESGGGGSEGGGESGGSEELLENCELRQIAYSLKNFNELSECMDYTLNGCSRLNATCGVLVQNLDDFVSGEFKLSIKLLDVSSGLELGLLEISKNLGPKEAKEFIANFDLTNEEGINEEISCDFDTIKIPSKEFCI